MEDLRRSQQDEPSAACAQELAADNEPLKYAEIPNHYVWDGKNSRWVKRKRRAKGGEVIGRMYQCSPKDPELYALRLLLLHVPGVESFPSLQHNDSFMEAAKIRGLARNVDEVDHILEEYLNSTASVSKQCELFALILVWHEVGDARELWEKNWRQIVAKDKGYREAKTEAERAANTPKATEATTGEEPFRNFFRNFEVSKFRNSERSFQKPETGVILMRNI